MEPLLECPSCARKSPPQRTDCLYCGAELPDNQVSSARKRTARRVPDEWENGFNVVLLPGSDSVSNSHLRNLEAETDLDFAELEKLFDSKFPFPSARLDVRSAADELVSICNISEIKATIVEDEALRLNSPQRRLRSLRFDEEKISLVMFNTSETIEIFSKSVKLIVIGSIFENIIETEERHLRTKENKALNIDQSSYDRKLIDIYLKDEPIGFRVTQTGFDFSGLGTGMSFLASDNVLNLFNLLSHRCPYATAVNVYDSIRKPLSKVWSLTETSGTKRIIKKGVANINFHRQIKVSNETQFTRYSRLASLIL